MKIYVISHKPFQLPTSDSIYQPLMVGQNDIDNKKYCFDHTGDHIAEKNGRYNELTGMYWIWKNVQEDVVGICHYRRYFVTPAGKLENLMLGKHTHFLQEDNIRKRLKETDMIVHNKTFFRESNCAQFSAGVNPYFWEAAKQEIQVMYPDYLPAFQRVEQRRYAHLLNMMIAKKELFDQYCRWLFPLLFQIEKRLEGSCEAEDMNRSMGMIGERLLDVWILKNQIRIRECFSVNMERKDWKVW